MKTKQEAKLLSKEQIAQKQASELARLIQYVGRKNLAAQLNVTPYVVNMWVQRGRISATKATEVERMSGGKFKRKEMRPDVHTWAEDV